MGFEPKTAENETRWRNWDACQKRVREISEKLPTARSDERVLSIYLETYEESAEIEWVERMESGGVTAGEMDQTVHLLNSILGKLEGKGRAVINTLADLQRAKESGSSTNVDVEGEFNHWRDHPKKEIDLWRTHPKLNSNLGSVAKVNEAMTSLGKTFGEISKLKQALENLCEEIRKAKASIFLHGLRNSLRTSASALVKTLGNLQENSELDQFVLQRLCDFQRVSPDFQESSLRALKLIDPSDLEGVYVSFVMCHVAGTGTNT